MYCSKCGMQIADGSAFCPSCGQQIQPSAKSQQQIQREDQIRGVVLNVLIDSLRKAETAMEALRPFAEKESDLRTECRDIESELEYTKNIASSPAYAPIILGILTAISLIGSIILYCVKSSIGEFDTFFGGFKQFAFIAIAGFIVLVLAIAFFSTLSTRLSAKSKIIKLTESLSKKKQELENAIAKSNEIGQAHREGCQAYLNYFPENCNSSEDMRVYVSFFETGRAQSIPEARNLFDEYKHRERMEELVAEQIYATRSAEHAAREAANAANSATQAAQQAKDSADRNYYNNLFGR